MQILSVCITRYEALKGRGRLSKISSLLSMCIGCFADVGVEGWLTDRSGYWAMRFHRDEQSDASDPRVFVDYGRGMPNGSKPALLKSRKHLSRKDAETQWNRLIEIGWTQVSPVWGPGIEP